MYIWVIGPGFLNQVPTLGPMIFGCCAFIGFRAGGLQLWTQGFGAKMLCNTSAWYGDAASWCWSSSGSGSVNPNPQTPKP